MPQPIPGEIQNMRISVIGPVLNEVEWIGYSIMAALPIVHEFIYALDEKSEDGTRELLQHLQKQSVPVKIIDTPNFHPSDTKAYNAAFNVCIEAMTGDVAWFLHPDMLVTKRAELEEGPLAWTVNVTSYAKDFRTVISKGRCTQWKNLHANKFGLQYLGAYGSSNEDFYHTQITGNSLRHYGTEFSKYPFEVATSGINVAHFCELKPYKRRLEKMKLCLKTQHPGAVEERIDEMAFQHPRVTLESSSNQFGEFVFSEATEPVPEVFSKYKAEFEPFVKELVYG
jgi:glycosyltransferase involved in cell wall biosynthesis